MSLKIRKTVLVSIDLTSQDIAQTIPTLDVVGRLQLITMLLRSFDNEQVNELRSSKPKTVARFAGENMERPIIKLLIEKWAFPKGEDDEKEAKS